MPNAPRRRVRAWPLVALAALALLAPAARADEYVIGPEDVLAVSVWLHPELERTVTVSAEGKITFPPVGDIQAGGLTMKQLSDRIGDRLSAYLRQTATVTVTVSKYLSRSVFVQGAVAKPDRYGFEQIPSLLDVLGTAGGALPGADLSGVQVLRKENGTRRTITADLSAALRTGDTSGLPELKSGDTIVVPGSAAGMAAPGEGVGVLGEVNKPGVFAVSGSEDLWSVLALAGGLTPRGNLSDVRVISRGQGGASVAAINLRAALDRGARAPQLVKAGDVVVVMPHATNIWAGFTGLLSLSRDALNIAVLVDYLHRRSTGTP